VQPKLLKSSNTAPSTDHQKVIKSPGTQLYPTLYGTSSLPKPKINHDPYDRSTNGLHNQLQTAQFKKLRKTNLNLTTRKCNNPVTTPYQYPKEPSVACHPTIHTTHGLLHPKFTQTSLTLTEQTTNRTTCTTTTQVIKEARKIAKDLLKNMQLLERYLRETAQPPKSTTEFQKSQTQPNSSNNCTTPIIVHLPSTETDHALMIQNPKAIPTDAVSRHKIAMQPYTARPSKLHISTEIEVMRESHAIHPDTKPPVMNAMEDSNLMFIDHTAIPADPSLSHHINHIPLPPSSHNAVETRSKSPTLSQTRPIPDNPTPAFNRPTFDAWCQQHSPMKKTICRRNTVVDGLLKPTTTNMAQDNPHNTATTRDSEFDKYPFPPQNTITSITLFLQVLAIATRTYVTILLPPTQLRIARTMRRRHVRFRYHLRPTTALTATLTTQYHTIYKTRYERIQYREARNEFLRSARTSKNLLRPP